MVSDSVNVDFDAAAMRVLILVLMEYGLGQKLKIMFIKVKDLS